MKRKKRQRAFIMTVILEFFVLYTVFRLLGRVQWSLFLVAVLLSTVYGAYLLRQGSDS